MIYEHWKGRLNAAQQRAYEDVLAAITCRQERIPVKGVQPQELSLIHKAVYYDHPELFYMTHAPSVQQSVSFFGTSVTFVCKSIFSSGVIANYQKKIEGIKAALTPAISSAQNDYEKEKIVCDYLLRNLTYHVDNTLNQNAGTALAQGRAQCSGFAKAVKLLLDWLNIPCIIIDGEVNDPATRQHGPHAWNIVCIDGVWYHLDVTLMLGANMQKTEPFRYLYLNWSDAQMRALHQWTPVGYPACVNEFTVPAANGGVRARQMPSPAPMPSRAPAQTPPAAPAPAPARNTNAGVRPWWSKPAKKEQVPAPAPTRSSGVRPRTAAPASGATPAAPAPVTGRGAATPPAAPQPVPANGAQTRTRVRKTVTSLAQFRRDINNVFRARLRMFEFLSSIPVRNRQELLDEVLAAACDEAGKQNLQVSIHVTVSGDNEVKVTLGW